MKLSIIVCVYNTKEESFAKCLDSIHGSTLKDYEVIVIDDGSVNDYTEILKKYSPVYVKTQNRGQLAARLYALLLAKGEYVAYVDSDDGVTFNYHEPMVNLAINEGCDIVMNDWAFKTENGYANCKGDVGIHGDVSLVGDEILTYFAKDQGKYRSPYALWNKVFKKSLLMKAKAEIEKTDAIMKKQTYNEDMLITFFAFKNAQKLRNIHTGYYFFDISVSKLPSEAVLKKNVVMAKRSFNIILDSLDDARQDIKENVIKWMKLMCAKHLSFANANGYDLADYIKLEYGIEDAKDFVSLENYPDNPLGDNLGEIDSLFRWILKKGEDVCVKYDKNDAYVVKSVEALRKECGIKITDGTSPTLIIPKRNITFKDKFASSKLGLKLRSLFKKQ